MQEENYWTVDEWCAIYVLRFGMPNPYNWGPEEEEFARRMSWFLTGSRYRIDAVDERIQEYIERLSQQEIEP